MHSDKTTSRGLAHVDTAWDNDLVIAMNRTSVFDGKEKDRNTQSLNILGAFPGILVW
jgi:hypothetical protein